LFKSKKLSLLMALVFAFTVIFPVAAIAADAEFGQSYAYISTDDKDAGFVTVEQDDDSVADSVYVEVTLPEGVEFEDKPDSSTNLNNELENATFVSAKSNWIRVEATDWPNKEVTIKFIEDLGLSIDKNFTGNINVDVEAIGVNAPNNIVWTETDTLTIAKVAESDVTVTVGDVKKVSVGGGKEVADITVEESKAGDLGNDENVYLEIETDGVSFNDIKTVVNGVSLQSTFLSLNEMNKNHDDYSGYDTWLDSNKVAVHEDRDKAWVKVSKNIGAFPGDIEFNISLDIDPDVTGEIEISVISDGEADVDETVTVATIGDVTAEVSDIEDNDTIVYLGQSEKLDVEFTLETTDGSEFEDGDMITFELNKGEFVSTPTCDGVVTPKLYKDDEAFYYTIGSNESDELTFEDLEILLDNSDEVGDITLTIGGDYGDLGEITIAQAAAPFTMTADVKNIMTEALNQEAGEITVTEADGGALKKGTVLIFELPSGVELNSKPKVDEEEGNIEVSVGEWGDDWFEVEIDGESSSKAGVFRIYNLKYDTGRLALAGDVELKVYTDTDDDILARVVNATVVDDSVVTATFTVGDEGVAVKNGRTLVQVNTLCDVLGLQKSWDEVNKIAYFVKGGTVVAFPIDKNEISINGNVLPVDQGGTIIDGFTYATLRGLEMAFGGTLDWDNDTKTAAFNFQK